MPVKAHSEVPTVFRTPQNALRLFILALMATGVGQVFVPQPLQAQDQSLVDRVAAVVGDSVIVLSQIQERVFQMEYQGVEIPPQGSAEWIQLQRDILDSMISEQLIVQAALQDTTIVVDDLEIEELVSEEMDNRVRNLGGQEAFESGLAAQGFTLTGYRDFLRGQLRQQRLYQQYMGKRSAGLSAVVVEEEEVATFFEEQREAIGDRPPTVEFAQIILAPTPSDSARNEALAEANRVLELAVGGEDFGELAGEYSQDPGSKDNGGDLGWFRLGDMVDAFEEAAFSMAVDQISQPVETPFGFHIIKVTRRRSGEVRASHILIPVAPTETDLSGTRSLASELKGRLESGEDFEALREEYGDLEEPDTLRYAFDQLQQLPPGFAEPLSRAEPGQILDPIEFETRGEAKQSIIKVLEVLPAGPATLEDQDLRSQIIQTLQQQKLVDQILEELRASTYIQIRM